MTGTMIAVEPQILGAGEGLLRWFLGNLVTIKTSGEQTGDAFSVTEHLAPGNFEPPPHIHHNEDEMIYVLEGEIAGFCGDQTFRGGPGAYVVLPRGIPHGWRVANDAPARMLVFTTPAGFERFVVEGSIPAEAPELPTAPVEPVDIARMQAAADKYGIEFLPPPA